MARLLVFLLALLLALLAVLLCASTAACSGRNGVLDLLLNPERPRGQEPDRLLPPSCMVTCFGQTLREIAQPTGSHLGTTRVVDAIEGYGGLVFGSLVWVALSV